MKKRKQMPSDWEEFEELAPIDLPNESEPTSAEERSDDEALSYEELQMLRATMEQTGEDRSQLPPHDTSDRAHLRRFAAKNKLLTAAVIVIALAVLAGIGFGIFLLVSHLNDRPNTSDFTVCLGQEEPYTVKYDDAVRDGVLYIDMKRVAEFTDAMIISGTKTRRKFTASDGTSLRFEDGSEVAEINGQRVEMEIRPINGGDKVLAKAIVNENECWVPWSFLVGTVAEGMILRLDLETNTITVKHIHYIYDGDKENAEPAKILFHRGDFSALPAMTEPPEYEWVYTIDIEPYLDAITSENLLLANKSNPLGEDFKPSIVTLDSQYCWSNEEHQLQADAAAALAAMMAEMKQAGIEDISVTSSYRSYAQQKYLFNKYVSDHMAEGMTREQAEAEASTYSARPGESEHQTGLCLDFTTQSLYGDLSNDFANTDAFRWLSENAYKFGFILRYPEDKVDITQYSYESWHYRFVGREAATEMYFNDLCLEEYLGETAE